jgi:competence ComEA-like helix-hairpin-helix protein
MKWFFFWLLGAGIAFGSELDKLTNVKLVDSPANDGDSFIVQAGDRQLHLRLYFADCPEVKVTNDVDAKRVREQAGYFGLTNVVNLVGYGRDAKEFTAKALAKPFTVYTAYADAMGRSPTKRFYAFIVTADGKDLASELVENGLARAYGAHHAAPDGVSSADTEKRMRDLESRAMLKRIGAWKNADPDEIVRQREAQREEEKQLSDVRRQVSQTQKGAGIVDLNTAGSRELQSLPGVGPALAGRIIAGRPYRSVDDLLHVKGVGTNLMEKIRSRVVVEAPKAR